MCLNPLSVKRDLEQEWRGCLVAKLHERCFV